MAPADSGRALGCSSWSEWRSPSLRVAEAEAASPAPGIAASRPCSYHTACTCVSPVRVNEIIRWRLHIRRSDRHPGAGTPYYRVIGATSLSSLFNLSNSACSLLPNHAWQQPQLGLAQTSIDGAFRSPTPLATQRTTGGANRKRTAHACRVILLVAREAAGGRCPRWASIVGRLRKRGAMNRTSRPRGFEVCDPFDSCNRVGAAGGR